MHHWTGDHVSQRDLGVRFSFLNATFSRRLVQRELIGREQNLQTLGPAGFLSDQLCYLHSPGRDRCELVCLAESKKETPDRCDGLMLRTEK